MRTITNTAVTMTSIHMLGGSYSSASSSTWADHTSLTGDDPLALHQVRREVDQPVAVGADRAEVVLGIVAVIAIAMMHVHLARVLGVEATPLALSRYVSSVPALRHRGGPYKLAYGVGVWQKEVVRQAYA